MDEELRQAGFNVDALTPIMKDIIMEPSYAPENYHQDGEITPRQALQFWKSKMERVGLSTLDIKRAVKLHFG